MKICYNCFYVEGDDSSFCQECGFPLGGGGGSDKPDALPRGETLYGRYLMGRVLQQDESGLFYTAQDSRSKTVVVIREYFPGSFAARSSMRTVSVPEDRKEEYAQGKEDFLELAENLSDAEEEAPELSGLSVRVQSYFSQNDTVYMVLEYDTPQKLREYLTEHAGLYAEVWDIPVRERTDEPESAPDSAAGTVNSAPDSAAGTVNSAQAVRPGAASPEEKTAQFAHPDGTIMESEAAQPFHPEKTIPETETTWPLPTDDWIGQTEALPGSGRAGTGRVPGSTAAAGAGTGQVPGSAAGAGTGQGPGSTGAAGAGTGKGPGSAPAAGAGTERWPGSTGAAGADRERKQKRTGAGAVAAVFGVIALCLILLAVLASRLFSGLSRSGFDPRLFNPRYIRHRIERELRKVEESEWLNRPEDKPEDISEWEGTEGITSGNFYNSGRFVLLGDDLYYSAYDGLYRAQDMEAGTDERVFASHAEFMNVYEDKIYYPFENERKILCFDPETEKTSVVYDCGLNLEYKPSTLYIYDEWAYFSNHNKLCRIPLSALDEKQPATAEDAETVLEDFNAPGEVYPSLCFAGGSLVYNGTGGITAVKPDGSDKKVLSKQTGMLVTDGKTIYCWHGVRKIDRVELTGETTEFLDVGTDKMIYGANYSDGWLYLALWGKDSFELRRIDADGNAEKVDHFGEKGDLLISLCTFPENKHVYAYLFRKVDDKYVHVHVDIPVD